MHFTTILSVAVSATAVTAVAVGSSTLQTREGNCGSYWDNYLGPGTAGNIDGGRRCHNLKKSGESPNAQSSYTVSIKGKCIHCDFYVQENCQQVSYGVGHSAGNDWQIQETWGHVKSFSC